MIDINYIIENKEHVKELLKRKLYDADIDSLVEDVETKRKLLKAVEDNKAKQNKLSKSVPQVKKEGGDVTKIFAEVKALAAENKIDEEKLKVLDEKINSVLVALPNLPDEDLLGGGKENNKEIYIYKTKPNFGFKIKNDVDEAYRLANLVYKHGGILMKSLKSNGTIIVEDDCSENAVAEMKKRNLKAITVSEFCDLVRME